MRFPDHGFYIPLAAVIYQGRLPQQRSCVEELQYNNILNRISQMGLVV